jgi:DNA ligase-1
VKTFPMLYKAHKSGALMQWEISVLENSDHSTGFDIWTSYGQVGGQIQQTRDLITEGKNPGKANATTAQQQALKEAQARWEKQVKKGYVEDREKAAKGEDDIGGVLPMLAHRYDEHGDKILFPCFVQPKLDGIRCIAIVENGKALLFSRTRKPITGMPHIQRELEERFPTGRLVLDGELYNHEYKTNFEQIVSLVRQEEAAENHSVVQYHVYDVVLEEEPYQLRQVFLRDIFSAHPSTQIILVQTIWVSDAEDVQKMYSNFVEAGYEGAIVRTAEGVYEHRRSYGLQKVKQFQDAEFPIVGCVEGRGKLAGHAIFECETEEGQRFNVKLEGSTAHLKELYENPYLWEGKYLTVQFQGFSNKNRVPRFPVGLRIREDE